ncbi:MAG: AMP nucleosidase [Bacteroidetes bacterium]|nr:AMP nucleosidase [Bacteroidota bacterium]
MQTKQEIVQDWLTRYTGVPLDQFGQYILLTNFQHYVNLFAEMTGSEIKGLDKPMSSATAEDITIINFGIGSPNTALVMDLLSAIKPEAVLFLGKCGGLKKRNNIGDFILPIGAIRGDGTSDDYFPKEVPAMPSFALQRAISSTIKDKGLNYWTGTVYTTNRRVWEHDEAFKTYLASLRAYAIDMETATLFIVGFHNKIPTGALLLVTDQPMIPDGVKTEAKDKENSRLFDKRHVEMGIESLQQLINRGDTIRHLKF